MEVEMNEFFTMGDGMKVFLPIMGDHCYTYRPAGWSFDVIEVRTKEGECIDMAIRR
jgi:hypothetical protein